MSKTRVSPTIMPIGQRYWLWVTHPEHYLDEAGREYESLDHDTLPEATQWWTCHRDTKQGDVAFLWRTSPRSDIGYVIQAMSDAYSLSADPYAKAQGWKFGCDYRTLVKLTPPIGLAEIRGRPELASWGALRAQFQGKVFFVSQVEGDCLLELADSRAPGLLRIVTSEQSISELQRINREYELETILESELHRLSPYGLRLSMFADNATGRTGRQFVCGSIGGRIDLLCSDETQDRLVVIELKTTKANYKDFGQISSYVGWVDETFRKKQPAIGLIISRGVDLRFQAAMRVTNRIVQIDLERIGFH